MISSTTNALYGELDMELGASPTDDLFVACELPKTTSELVIGTNNLSKTINNYIIGPRIGVGSFGRVYAARLATDPEPAPDTPGCDSTAWPFAIKIYSRAFLSRLLTHFGTGLVAVRREHEVHFALQAGHVLPYSLPQLIEVIDDGKSPQCYAVLPNYSSDSGACLGPDGGFGPDAWAPIEPMPHSLARELANDVVLALRYLHASGIAHRDVKPANVILTHRPTPRTTSTTSTGTSTGAPPLAALLLDFGVALPFFMDQTDGAASTSANSGPPTAVGSAAFQPPEVLLPGGRAGAPAAAPLWRDRIRPLESTSGVLHDAWSLGVLLYCWLSGHLPYSACSHTDLRSAMLSGPPPRLPYGTDPLAADLIRGLLNPSPSRRLTVTEAACHPWLTSYGTRPPPPLPASARLPYDDASVIAQLVCWTPPLHPQVSAALYWHGVASACVARVWAVVPQAAAQRRRASGEDAQTLRRLGEHVSGVRAEGGGNGNTTGAQFGRRCQYSVFRTGDRARRRASQPPPSDEVAANEVEMETLSSLLSTFSIDAPLSGLGELIDDTITCCLDSCSQEQEQEQERQQSSLAGVLCVNTPEHVLGDFVTVSISETEDAGSTDQSHPLSLAPDESSPLVYSARRRSLSTIVHPLTGTSLNNHTTSPVMSPTPATTPSTVSVAPLVPPADHLFTPAPWHDSEHGLGLGLGQQSRSAPELRPCLLVTLGAAVGCAAIASVKVDCDLNTHAESPPTRHSMSAGCSSGALFLDMPLASSEEILFGSDGDGGSWEGGSEWPDQSTASSMHYQDDDDGFHMDISNALAGTARRLSLSMSMSMSFPRPESGQSLADTFTTSNGEIAFPLTPSDSLF